MSALDAVRRPFGGDLGDTVKSFASSTKATPSVIRRVIVAALFLSMVQSIFHLFPQGRIGVGSLGGLYGMTGVGIVRTYGTSRVINFAAAAGGAVPATAAGLL